MNTSTIQHWILCVSCTALVACGSSNDLSGTEVNGDLEIAVTDAEEDFITYKIELDNITLVRNDGTRVDVLPVETEVDFVQYQDLSELFAVMSIPSGFYTDIEMTLDYSDAEIVVQDDAGETYLATVQNTDGAAIEVIDLNLTLNDSELLHITPFKTARLTLDLDLAASNTIESFEPALVTVEPFMIGTTYLDEEREHRVRGLLEDVDRSDETVSLQIRPMRLYSDNFGFFTFSVSEDSLYDIDGVEYEGTEGLEKLNALPLQTPVVAYGKASESGYTASQILAGTSVPWANDDVLKGVVTARQGNILSIQGAVVEPSDGSAVFRTQTEVLIDSETTITGYRLGDADQNQVSVGQRIIALGEFDFGSNEFDARASGHVQMKLNRISGEVLQQTPLELDLSTINKRPVDIFDFTGTGSEEALDSNPSQYEINTSTLDLSGLEDGEWAQVRGYPTAFGDDGGDFDALSIIDPDLSSHPSTLFVAWPDGAEDTVLVSEGGLDLQSDEARVAFKLRGIPGSTIEGFTVDRIVGHGEMGRYAISHPTRGIAQFRHFEDFISGLEALVLDGGEVTDLGAHGLYNELRSQLSAHYVTVRVE